MAKLRIAIIRFNDSSFSNIEYVEPPRHCVPFRKQVIVWKLQNFRSEL